MTSSSRVAVLGEGVRAASLACAAWLGLALLDCGWYGALFSVSSLDALGSAALGVLLLFPLMAGLAALLGHRLARPWVFRLEVALVVSLYAETAWALVSYGLDPRLPLRTARLWGYAYGFVPALLLGFLASRWWKSRPASLRAVLAVRGALVPLALGLLWWIPSVTILYIQERIAWVLLAALLGIGWALRSWTRAASVGAALVLVAGVAGGARLGSSVLARDHAARGGKLTRLSLRRSVVVLRWFGAEVALLERTPPASLPAPEAPTEPRDKLRALEESSPKNIILITVDALRADLGGLENAPNFARLRRESLVFENAYSPASNTVEAVGALFFGRYDFTGFPGPSLARLFADAGWDTIAVLPGAYIQTVEHNWIASDFRAYTKRLPYKIPQGPISPEMTEKVLADIDAAQGKRLFVWVHYNDPHHPYDGEGETAIERYQSEVARMDSSLGALFNGLSARGVLDESLLVLTADHGEEFGEHGGATHGLTLFEESVRVPLFLRTPRASLLGSYAQPVSTLALAPLLVRAAKIQAPPSFAPGRAELLSPAPVFAFRRLEPDLSFGDAMVRWGAYKLIYSIETESAQLYNLETDPRETENLVEERPEVASTLAAALRAEIARALSW